MTMNRSLLLIIGFLTLSLSASSCRTAGKQVSLTKSDSNCAAEEKALAELEAKQSGDVPTSDSTTECRKVSGAKWSSERSRCECISDPTKFEGNAWSIRNHLKCDNSGTGDPGDSRVIACKNVRDARWNNTIGRCECISDPTKFYGNDYMIRNSLKCDAPSSTEGETDDDLALALQTARDALEQCRARGDNGGRSDNCTADGGKLGEDKVCRCSNGTPVFKLHGQTCAQHLAKQTDECKKAQGTVYDSDCICSDGKPLKDQSSGVCQSTDSSNQQGTAKITEVGGVGMSTTLQRSGNQMLLYVYLNRPVQSFHILAGDRRWYPATASYPSQPGWPQILSVPVAPEWVNLSSVMVLINGRVQGTVPLDDKR